MLGTVRRQNPKLFASLLAGCFGIGVMLSSSSSISCVMLSDKLR